MKKIISISALVGSLLFTTACVDLTQEPKSFVTQEDYLESIDETSLAKLTQSLYTDLWYNNYGFNTYVTCVNVSADDMMYREAKANNRLSYYYLLNPSISQLDKDMGILWTLFWKAIKDANDIINLVAIPSDQAEAEKYKQLIGESYFVRGLSYFYLVRVFGDIPLILNNNEADNRMPRTSVAEIYDKAIVPSLKTAAEWLPNISRSDDPSSPSKWAAKACLADVYMTMAGWPLKKGNEYYGYAADLTEEIIDNAAKAELRLEGKYEDLWKEANKRKRNEVMFALLHSVADKTASQYGTSYYPSDFSPNAGWADYYADEKFFLSYPNDERKEWNYMTEWDTKNGHVQYTESADGLPAISKYYNYDSDLTQPGKSAQSNGITSIYRYADVLLMYAEASTRATGSVSSKALSALQDVQKRAGYERKGLPLTETTNADEFLEAVFKENGWEFFAEMRRWFDLVRLEKVQEAKGDEIWNNSLFKAQGHYYFPIPSDQIQLTGWANNKGY